MSKLFDTSLKSDSGRFAALVQSVVEAGVWVASSSLPVTIAVAGVLGY